MKECQFCKEDIKEAAKVCPHCQRRQKTDIESAVLDTLKIIIVFIISFLSFGLFVEWIANLIIP